MTSSGKVLLPGASGSGPFHVITAWATAFTALYPEAEITFNSIGSGATQKALWGDIDCYAKPINALCKEQAVADRTVWGIGDAPLSSSHYDDHSFWQLQQYPAAAGAVLIVHGKEVTRQDSSSFELPLNMTFEVMAGIFNNSITFWDDDLLQDLNPAITLPHEAVSVVVRSDGSGQTNILTESLGYQVPTWPQSAVGRQPQWPIGQQDGSTTADATSMATLDDYSRAQSTCRRYMEQAREPTSEGTEENETRSSVVPFVNEDIADPNALNQTCRCDGGAGRTIAPTTIPSTAVEASLPQQLYGVDGKTGVAFGLMRIPYAVGYMEMGYYRELDAFMAQAHISNGSKADETQHDIFTGATKETLKATMNGLAHKLDPKTLGVELSHSSIPGGYPIAGYAYWYVKHNPAAFDSCYQAWLLCKFIEWAYTDPLAEELAAAEGWITPPLTVVEQSLARLQQVKCQTSDGDIIAAVTYTPEAYLVDHNYLDQTRPAAFVLASIVMATSLLFIVWIQWRKTDRVVNASQPTFLVLICVGTFIMGSAILPLSIDDSLVSLEGCHIACMSWVWLLPIGFSLSFSALFSKIWRLNLLLKSAKQFKRLKIETTDVLVPLGTLMTLNVTLLVAWTIVDPLKWTREQDSPLSSIGRCVADGDAWIAFAVLIAMVNFGALVLANVEAYKARGISDEYAETRYIAIAMVSMLQALLLGIPLSIMVNDNSPARLFTYSGIIFVTSMSLLLLIFIPKLYHIRQDRKRQDHSSSERTTGAEGVKILGQLGAASTVFRESRTNRSSLESSNIADLSIRFGNATTGGNHMPSSFRDSLGMLNNPIMSSSFDDPFGTIGIHGSGLHEANVCSSCGNHRPVTRDDSSLPSPKSTKAATSGRPRRSKSLGNGGLSHGDLRRISETSFENSGSSFRLRRRPATLLGLFNLRTPWIPQHFTMRSPRRTNLKTTRVSMKPPNYLCMTTTMTMTNR